jgi:hypothetical protein
MEEQEDGWLTVLEKNGLGPAAAILENESERDGEDDDDSATYDDDQKKSHADYIELSMKSQFNIRVLW